MENITKKDNEINETCAELERGVYAALETYSNVHRGSGQFSMVSTHLFEQARNIVLDYLGLKKGRYVVIFCTPRRSAVFMKQLKPETCQVVSGRDIGLSLGVCAVAVQRKALPSGIPFETGGGTTRLVSKDWVIWAGAPDRFEAGTPPIINIIAFARGLHMIKQSGKEIFKDIPAVEVSASGILYDDELEKFSGLELLHRLRQNLIGNAVLVPTCEGYRPYINMDNSASTPAFTPVWNAFRQTLFQSVQVKQAIIHEVKDIIAKVLGAPLVNFDIIFTSNTTEAINLVSESLSHESDEGCGSVILNTILEHSSNDLPWRKVQNYSLIRISVDDEGFVDLNGLDKLLSSRNHDDHYGEKRIGLVAISGASNVLGVCNNITEISRIVHQYGARLLVDAAQLIAHRSVNMEESEIDYLAFSAHKVYAPFGCGVLIVRKGLLNFNSSELDLIRTSGEENAGGIASLGKALVLLQRIGMEVIMEKEQFLTGRILKGLAQINDLTIYGMRDPASPEFVRKTGVIVFSMKNLMPNRIAKELAIRSGIGVRYGCHCAHLLIKHLLNVTPFLERFQGMIQTLFPKLRFPGLVRVSLGIENSEEEVDKLINVLGKLARQPRESDDCNSYPIHNRQNILKHKDVKIKMNDFVRASARRVYT